MFRRRLALLPEQPALQPIEIDIDNRRRIEREKLRQRETADDDFRAGLDGCGGALRGRVGALIAEAFMSASPGVVL